MATFFDSIKISLNSVLFHNYSEYLSVKVADATIKVCKEIVLSFVESFNANESVAKELITSMWQKTGQRE